MPHDMLTQAIANLEAVAAEMRCAGSTSPAVQCWADKVLTAVSDLKEAEVPSTKPDGLVEKLQTLACGACTTFRGTARFCATCGFDHSQHGLRSAADALSAAQRLIDQWREKARPHLNASGDEADWANCRAQCADELAALLSAPAHDERCEAEELALPSTGSSACGCASRKAALLSERSPTGDGQVGK